RTAPGTGVVGLSRKSPEQSGAWLTADLNDRHRLPEVLATRPDITHIVYASRAPHAETGVEDVPGNLRMLRNLLDAAEAALPGFAHPHSVVGGKWSSEAWNAGHGMLRPRGRKAGVEGKG